MLDRVPTKPGRVLITPEGGGAPYYATVTRADEPVQEGTPLNKASLLTDAVAGLYSLTSTATLNDVLNKIKTLLNGKAPTNHRATGTTYGAATGSYYGHVKLSDAIDSASGAASGIAATPAAVKTVADALNQAALGFRVECGEVQSSGSAANFSITFQHPFPAPPIVIATAYERKNAYRYMYSISLSEISASSAHGYTYYATSGGAESYPFLVEWIAIGAK